MTKTHSDTPSPYLKAACAMIVGGFEAEIRPRFGTLSDADVERKGVLQTAAGDVEDDLVTTADKAMEDYVTKVMAVRHPDAVLVGEEGNEKNSSLLTDLKNGRKPSLDSIDGTALFNAGKPGFGVLFADQFEGVTTAAIILRTFLKPGGRLDYELIMGDDESGVWHSAGLLKPFTRLLPFSERPVQPERKIPSGIVTARYFNSGILQDEQAVTAALRYSNDVYQSAKLRLQESDSSVNLWSDLALGKIDFIAVSATKPWDNNAGAKIVRLLGGDAVSLDTGEAYAPWRIDGGLFAARHYAIGEKAACSLFITGTAPLGSEPCRSILWLEPTRRRLLGTIEPAPPKANLSDFTV